MMVDLKNNTREVHNSLNNLNSRKGHSVIDQERGWSYYLSKKWVLGEEAFKQIINRNLPLGQRPGHNKQEQEDKPKTLDQGPSKLLIWGASPVRTKASSHPTQKHNQLKVTQMFFQVKHKVTFQAQVWTNWDLPVLHTDFRISLNRGSLRELKSNRLDLWFQKPILFIKTNR